MIQARPSGCPSAASVTEECDRTTRKAEKHGKIRLLLSAGVARKSPRLGLKIR